MRVAALGQKSGQIEREGASFFISIVCWYVEKTRTCFFKKAEATNSDGNGERLHPIRK